jgi:hypothetical protein
MNDVRFPLMLTRPNEKGSTSLTVYNLQELQKALSAEISVSYGYSSMCDATEIVGTLRRRGYFVKQVRFASLGDE